MDKDLPVARPGLTLIAEKDKVVIWTKVCRFFGVFSTYLLHIRSKGQSEAAAERLSGHQTHTHLGCVITILTGSRLQSSHSVTCDDQTSRCCGLCCLWGYTSHKCMMMVVV